MEKAELTYASWYVLSRFFFRFLFWPLPFSFRDFLQDKRTTTQRDAWETEVWTEVLIWSWLKKKKKQHWLIASFLTSITGPNSRAFKQPVVSCGCSSLTSVRSFSMWDYAIPLKWTISSVPVSLEDYLIKICSTVIQPLDILWSCQNKFSYEQRMCPDY